MLFKSFFLVVALSLPSLVPAQLAGSSYPIGPLTSSDAKWAVKVCDVTDYGAVADRSTDIGPPLLAAFNACKTGGIGGSGSGLLIVAFRLTCCSQHSIGNLCHGHLGDSQWRHSLGYKF
jgi:rhamnogalacturonan hydrolase